MGYLGSIVMAAPSPLQSCLNRVTVQVRQVDANAITGELADQRISG